MGTKNNPKNRGLGSKKQYNGKDVEPIMYYGKAHGNGNYLAVKYSKTSDVIMDESGKPMKWDTI